MKKFLYNQARTKIFNLDMVVSIEKAPIELPDKTKHNKEVIYLRFPLIPAEGLFAIYGNQKDFEWCNHFHIRDYTTMNGFYEVNQKLYQYFNHKFTHSALCQKTNNSKI